MSSEPIGVAAARELLLAQVVGTASEGVALGECAGRVTAAAVLAPAPVPGFDNSAMDGYAVRSADLTGGSRPLRVVAESRAGLPATTAVGAGEAARISTGAMIPAGADAVVRLEEAREEGETVVPTAAPVLPGAHIRRAGEDVPAGAEALPAGTTIGAPEIAVLASLGLESVTCARPPRLTVLTGGDELLAPGEAAGPGKIYDSNRFALVAMARRLGAEATYAGGMPDDRAGTREAIAAALDAELLVLCGGVSVGRHDHVKEALAELGIEQLFWRVALRPGGPTWGGVLRRASGPPTLVFGLPGNPVSAQVTFRLFVQPAILAATGRVGEPPPVRARLGAGVRSLPARDQYLRCRLVLEVGGVEAIPTGERQGSHILASMLGAECLAVIPAARGTVEAGEEVEVLLL